MKSIITDKAHLWKPKALEGISLFKAQFQHFAYAKHAHDEFAIGVIERGAQRFQHKDRAYIAPSGSIITVNPGDVHDGKTATSSEYQYRMSYIRPDMILTDLYGSKFSSTYFDSPVTFDNELSKGACAVPSCYWNRIKIISLNLRRVLCRSLPVCS